MIYDLIVSQTDSATDDEMPLPQGWRLVPLREVCKFVYGSSLSSANREKGEVPVYGSNGIVGFHSRALTKGKAIIIGRKGSVGEVNFSEIDCFPIDTTYFIDSTATSLDLRFLFYLLKAAKLTELNKSTAIPGLNREDAYSVIVPLPQTIEEQRRIAADLDEQMKAVEQARRAVEEQLEAANQLPKAYLRSVFESDDTNDNEKRKLGELLRLRNEVVHPRNNPKGEATFVGLEHIESNTGKRIGSINVKKEDLTGRKPQFFKNDLVYGYLRPYLNKLWKAEFDGLCSVDQYVYSVNEIEADTDYLAYFMRSPVYLSRAPIDATPGQLPRIRTEEVTSVEINLPEIEDQKKTVAVLSTQMQNADHLRTNLMDQLRAINNLAAALLRKAFSGEI